MKKMIPFIGSSDKVFLIGKVLKMTKYVIFQTETTG